jgi:hypothetical protein
MRTSTLRFLITRCGRAGFMDALRSVPGHTGLVSATVWHRDYQIRTVRAVRHLCYSSSSSFLESHFCNYSRLLCGTRWRLLSSKGDGAVGDMPGEWGRSERERLSCRDSSTVGVVGAAARKRIVYSVALWVGGLFPIYLGLIYFLVWFRRGSVWPVKCNYPITQTGDPCGNTAAGEWRKCRLHSRPYYYKSVAGGHTVVPKLCRWEKIEHGQRVVLPLMGVGVFHRVPIPETFLFCHGFARPFWNVREAFCGRMRTAMIRLRTMRLHAPTEEEVALEKRASVEGVDVAEVMASVVQACRFTLYAFGVALVATGVAALLPETPRAMVQWTAILGFVLAWAAIRNGVYQRKEEWLGGTCLAALKWWAWAFVPVAAVGLVIGP